eukprot:1161466-Pelagomonas_calceolata.AAC.10
MIITAFTQQHGRPEDEALDSLRIISAALAQATHLKELNLSDNALGEKGVRACSEALTKQWTHAALAALATLGAMRRHGPF